MRGPGEDPDRNGPTHWSGTWVSDDTKGLTLYMCENVRRMHAFGRHIEVCRMDRHDAWRLLNILQGKKQRVESKCGKISITLGSGSSLHKGP